MSEKSSRRRFLLGVAGAAAGAAATAASATIDGSAADAADAATKQPAAFSFHGTHQAGVLAPVRRSTALLALDVTAQGVDGLKALLQTITERLRFLTAGGTPQELGITAAPSDSGVLGPEVVAGGLTATLAVGASLFDERFGLASVKPAKLRTMEDFPNDDLDRSICDGDLLLQFEADDNDVVVHAVREVLRATRAGMQLRWRQDGFASPPRPSGTPRNLMGFKDGTANPDRTDAKLMDQLVWVHGGARGEPAWAAGGSYLAVRKIRMLVEFWDRVGIEEQQQMFGRYKGNGAPLTGSAEHDDPHYERDPNGDSIPLSAHIRVANPRTPGTEDQRMLRRAFNYDGGVDANGNLDQGLVFTAFNQDLERQFVTVQKRLIDEPLVDYISPVGGGYFFAVPGAKNSSDWLGKGLFA
ncbi:iron uptake transporter deferrochelatase/peroxidase subunit [Gryllotalpicola protaetiae]|uniref:Deferrochelatase n=1 Tax=Gryllotalpicola protaetiae TaxID=2419771 RepID=A0A387BIT9_9MICO|nr:iron uptake transporter deferrochelatase/peroxidase subunit [Gryllotalpicola protaetiae]AYG03733.1 deferrochelatase/peroxidase EfeB [Gryllotalpicola protaetiae]